jgi:hypothetical protein
MDNRTAKFRDWLISACGYSHLCCARDISPDQAIGLIGAYVDHMAITPYDSLGNLPMSNTLGHHVQSAYKFLLSVTPRPFTIYTGTGKQSVYIPFIGDKLAQRKKWQKPRPKREAYTFAMFQTFHAQVTAAEKQNPRTFLDRHSLIFNTQCLGIFTGSRVSEYCQSKGKISEVSRVPAAPGKPEDSGLPIAFIAADFCFLTDRGTHLAHAAVFANQALAHQLQITFRHDKSGRNYSVRKYARGRTWLCPIAAAIKLLYRAHLLQTPPNDPICAYRRLGTSGRRYLRDTEVTDTMRKICIATYKDPSHFLRVNIARIASHSNRVTAAVALYLAKISIDVIAHRLRWMRESVSFYLRESACDIDQYTADTIHGAQRHFC